MGSIAVEGPAGPILTRGLHAHLGSLLSRGVKASYCASELNRTLWDVAPEHTFSGVFIAHIDSAASRMDYVNAGHEAALVIRAAGSFERLEPHAPILGLSRRSEYRERTIRFSSGDALIVLSEGAGEAAERLLRGGVPEITRELAAKIVDAGDACRDRTAILIHNTSHRFAMVA
jgi:serine phosphatase RsbU (regulator of sigma subunit)